MGFAEDVFKGFATTASPTINPFPGLFTLGAGVNQATGGKSPTYSIGVALRDSSGTRYSSTTQWISGYSGDTPGSGAWRLPVLNDEPVQALRDIIPPWALPVAIAAVAVGVAVALR